MNRQRRSDRPERIKLGHDCRGVAIARVRDQDGKLWAHCCACQAKAVMPE